MSTSQWKPRPGPLSGTRVVELGGGISAAYATRLLAELGADVVKVEDPAGDPTRRRGPFATETVDQNESGLFHALNFEKRGVTLDLELTSSRSALDALLAAADVVIDNTALATRQRLQLDGPSCLSRHPHLVAVSVTPYGDEGPYGGEPGSALTSAALGGASWLLGSPDREPLTLPYDLADYMAGASAASAALSARVAATLNGYGQTVDVTVSGVVASFVSNFSVLMVDYGRPWRREGRRAAGSAGAYPYGIFPCKDGSVALIGRTPQDWRQILAAMGTPTWTAEERFQDPFRVSMESADEADAYLIAWMKDFTRDELREIADEYGLALAAVRTIPEVMEEPQFAFRGAFTEPIAVGSRTITPGLGPGVMSAYVRDRNVRRAPCLGEHNHLLSTWEN